MNATASTPETAPTTDISILDRISEQDIHEWLKARFRQIKETQLESITSFNLTVHNFGYGNTEVWSGMHAAGECVTTEADTAAAATELRAKLMGNPESKALQKRREAESLLKEAQQLEALAKQTPAPAAA